MMRQGLLCGQSGPSLHSGTPRVDERLLCGHSRRSIINWEALSEAGTISAGDLDLFKFVETAQEAVAVIEGWQN